ncbi:MAG TPA: phospholipid carrier-dependent glycosyltransferase, partial [Terriglobales bacterium]|nr:phospholipid carrier-dependent glycosyltransferase [Terriglobales bacterium]
MTDGLPGVPHPDEQTIVGLAVRFGTGDLNPHFFNYPTLWTYAVFGGYLALYAGGRLLGWVDSPAAFAAAYAVDPTPWFATGRVMAAVLGAATVPLAWHLARALGASPLAWLAAAAVALSPLHIAHSRLTLNDVPLAFATTAALVLLVDHARGAGRWPPWGLGLAAGLAVSVKYTAMALLIPLVLAVALRAGRGERLGAVLRAGAAMAAGFVAGTPFALLDP